MRNIYAGISSWDGINGSNDFDTCYMQAQTLEAETGGSVYAVIKMPAKRFAGNVDTLSVVTDANGTTTVDAQGAGHLYDGIHGPLIHPVPCRIAVRAIKINDGDPGSVDITITASNAGISALAEGGGAVSTVLVETTSLPITRGSMTFSTE